MTGGNIYSRMVYDILKQRGFSVVKKNAYTPYHGTGFTYVNALNTYFLKESKTDDIDIMDYQVGTWCSRRHRGKRIIVMFHFDLEETRKKKKHQFFFKRFLKNAKDAQIVVIAQYWENYLLSLGHGNIEVIYCAFDVDKYKPYISRGEFLKKFGLPDKPIIYLGKNSKPKTFNAYQIVKPLENDYLIITTGPVKEFNGPVHLDLDFNDYTSLLHFCSLTLLMPRFSEGWSRIAHESLICGTPVIGNGKGGMRELLEKSNQIIIDDNQHEEIRCAIREITAVAKRVNQEDSLYAKKFDLKYFGDRWETLIKNLLPPGSQKSQ